MTWSVGAWLHDHPMWDTAFRSGSLNIILFIFNIVNIAFFCFRTLLCYGDKLSLMTYIYIGYFTRSHLLKMAVNCGDVNKDDLLFNSQSGLFLYFIFVILPDKFFKRFVSNCTKG